jgi:hypothetical protein
MSAALTELWPFLILVTIGFLPNEIWRVFGLMLARGLNEDSEIVSQRAKAHISAGQHQDEDGRHARPEPVKEGRCR